MSCWYPRPFWFYDEKHYAACGYCPGCVHVNMERKDRLNRRETRERSEENGKKVPLVS